MSANEKRKAGTAKGGTPILPVEHLAERLFEGNSTLSGEQKRLLAAHARDFMDQRGVLETKVRIHTPAPEASVTIIEAVNPDAPLLVESTLAALIQFGIEPVFVQHLAMPVIRDENGILLEAGAVSDASTPESLIHIHVEIIEDEKVREALAEELRLTHADVQIAARDQLEMRHRISEALAACEATSVAADPENEEAMQFLRWLLNGNFTFVGLRTYRHVDDREGGRLEGMFDIGLGILRDPGRGVLLAASSPFAYSDEFRAFLRDRSVVAISKSSVRSRVGRRAELDYIAVRLPNSEGAIRGELKVLGLFSFEVYSAPTRDIPVLRGKLARMIERSGFDPKTHSGRMLNRVLEEYPRDDLFHFDEDMILKLAMDVVPLYSLPRIKAVVRADRFGRFASVLIFVPRDRYSSELRRAIGTYLERVLDGTLSEFEPAFPHGTSLARVRFIISLNGALPDVDEAAIEAEVGRLAQGWTERLRTQLRISLPAPRSASLAGRYAGAFDAGYQEQFTPAQGVRDIEVLEGLTDASPLAFRFFEMPNRLEIGLKIFARAPIALSTRVPMLDAMGFLVINETTYAVEPTGAEPSWVHDMTLARARGGEIPMELSPLLEALLLAVSGDEAESDSYNALVLEGELHHRDVALLRAVSRYLRQALIPFSHDYMAQVLVKYPAIAVGLCALFYARFDPACAEGRADAEKTALEKLEQSIGEVETLDEDRILRRFVNLMQSTLRTNFFQASRELSHGTPIAFKLDGKRVDALPEPRPDYEIFVTAPSVEGVHLRFGKVARGGLRWSDRSEDYRTEVLGLVKAQQVKNALIVPMGAKGGFVPKRLPDPSDREAWLKEGKAAYRLFISSLLDVTDDIKDGRDVGPEGVVCHDGKDPYLVVAADKGTASFSDIANEIAAKRNFWLGDAFASGGSAGYNHKGMGITARGAWESVKRHFREIGIDTQTMPFTVAGVGDMSGDVFGNGMLLSRHIRLVAAFDHRHIFIDPAPDAAPGWQERKRLFDLPRSSWADYDPALISAGGGVFARSAKSIPLSAPAAALLGLAEGNASPHDVVSAILRLDVDLLYFGGIGTYIRGTQESNAEVGDRANDPIRVTGAEIRAAVIGEGANLGMTQRGRIECALHGVRLNTDAIDNSAGVNTSDYEVNIKIGLSGAQAAGRITPDERRELLALMTDDIAALVLANNYRQTLALTQAQARNAKDLALNTGLMRSLESRGLLNRTIEVLPSDLVLSERAQQGAGLSRPELAILLAYAKNDLFSRILQSSIPEESYFADELRNYFPQPLVDRFWPEIEQHRLRREIIATRLTNSMIDFGGPSFAHRLLEHTGGDITSAVKAFVVVRDCYELDDLTRLVDALDTKVSWDIQGEMYGRIQELLLEQTAWFIREADLASELTGLVERFKTGATELKRTIDGLLSQDTAMERDAEAQRITAQGVPAAVADWIANLPIMKIAPDAILVGQETGRTMGEAAAALLGVQAYFGLDALMQAASGIVTEERFERIVRDRAIAEIAPAVRRIASVVLTCSEGGGEAVRAWAAERPQAEEIRSVIAGAAGPETGFARISVAADMLSRLTPSS